MAAPPIIDGSSAAGDGPQRATSAQLVRAGRLAHHETANFGDRI
jgi:hypothetical protein